jgi:hypothetical protein
VQVTLTLPGDVTAYFDDNELELDLYDVGPPVPWGSASLSGLTSVPPVEPIDVFRTGARIESEDGKIVVTLVPVDVRPGSPHDLTTVHLLLPESYAGETLAFSWRATSKSAAGAVAGMLKVAVHDEPVDTLELVNDD